MTLLEAVKSLGLIEIGAVSFIQVVPLRSHQYTAYFTIALLLPFLDPELPEEFRVGERRFWPDQVRLLESHTPIEDQIVQLHKTRTLGNLSRVYLGATTRSERDLWIIKTHCGTDQERLMWTEAVIEAEGRFPRREALQ
jgi:hypothetical protein